LQNGSCTHAVWLRWLTSGVVRVRPIRLLGVWAAAMVVQVARASVRSRVECMWVSSGRELARARGESAPGRRTVRQEQAPEQRTRGWPVFRGAGCGAGAAIARGAAAATIGAETGAGGARWAPPARGKPEPRPPLQLLCSSQLRQLLIVVPTAPLVAGHNPMHC